MLRNTNKNGRMNKTTEDNCRMGYLKSQAWILKVFQVKYWAEEQDLPLTWNLALLHAFLWLSKKLVITLSQNFVNDN